MGVETEVFTRTIMGYILLQSRAMSNRKRYECSHKMVEDWGNKAFLKSRQNSSQAKNAKISVSKLIFKILKHLALKTQNTPRARKTTYLVDRI
jgi:hypothetical protein